MILQNIQSSVVLGASVYIGSPAVPAALVVNDSNQSTAGTGSTAGNADGIVNEFSISIVSGTPFVLDCSALTYLGVSVPAAHVVAIKIQNISGGGTLTHGGGSNPLYATAPLPIETGGTFLWEALEHGGTGCPVAGGTKNLQITASTGTVVCELTIITRSA